MILLIDFSHICFLYNSHVIIYPLSWKTISMKGGEIHYLFPKGDILLALWLLLLPKSGAVIRLLLFEMGYTADRF